MTTLPDYPNLLVAIGASAGGLDPILDLVQALPDDLQAALVIVMHRNPDAPDNALARIVDLHANARVSEPFTGEHIHCQTIYVGHPNDQVYVEGRQMKLGDAARDHLSRLQRIDDTFRTVAQSAGPNSVGVILSGTLWDGAAGLKAIADAGGRCLVQDPADAAFAQMPAAALQAVDSIDIDRVGTVDELVSALLDWAEHRACR